MAVEPFDPKNPDHRALVDTDRNHVCSQDNEGHLSKSLFDPTAPLLLASPELGKGPILNLDGQ
jgi:hypothetical protein